MRDDIQAMSIRIPTELWKYVRLIAYEKKISMNEVICRCLKKFKDERENMLT